MKTSLDILLLKDSVAGAWTSQCLQYDIAAQGETIRESIVSFLYALAAEVAYGVEVKQQLDDPLAGLGPAPEMYRQLFDTSGERVMPTWEPPAPDVLAKIHAAMPGLGELRAA